jgi:hypothetical protein
LFAGSHLFCLEGGPPVTSPSLTKLQGLGGHLQTTVPDASRLLCAGADVSNPLPHVMLPNQDGPPLLGRSQVVNPPASSMPQAGPEFTHRAQPDGGPMLDSQVASRGWCPSNILASVIPPYIPVTGNNHDDPRSSLSACEEHQPGPIAVFQASVCKPLMSPIVRTPAPRRRARAPATADGLPRWSARVAAQDRRRVSNPEVQAQNVLMRKWKITSDKKSPDAQALIEYDSIFRSPLGSFHRKAIRALLFTNCPPSMVEVTNVDP